VRGKRTGLGGLKEKAEARTRSISTKLDTKKMTYPEGGDSWDAKKN